MTHFTHFRSTLWLSLITLLVACEPPPPPPVLDQTERPARLFRVAASAGETAHQFVGRVEASQVIDVAFEVPGILASIPIREGQTLPQGSLLATLDQTNYQLAVRGAAKQMQIAEQDYQRKYSILAKRGISKAAVDDAQTLLELRQVELQQAKEKLADTYIRAPFDAYIAERYVDNHVVITPGQKIARLSDLSVLHVVANIPAALFATVDTDDIVNVEAGFSFLAGQTFPLHYRENKGDADSVAQTYEVVFAMTPPAELNILPGMSASVQVYLGTPNTGAGFKIPAAAVVSDAEHPFFVWTYDPQSHAISKRGIEVKPADGGYLIVSHGLQQNDLIVAAGAHELQPGMRVRPMATP